MTDTTNTPPLPEHPWGQQDLTWTIEERQAIQQYGDARAAHAVSQMSKLEAGAILEYGIAVAAHAVAQIKAREITDAEIDALLLRELTFEPEHPQNVYRLELHKLVRAAIALANGRG